MLWHHWCLYIIWKKPIHNCGRNFCNPEVQVELQHMNVCMRQKTCKLEQMRTLGSGSLPSVHLIWVLWAISPKPWAVSVGPLHTDGNRVHINCTQESLSISSWQQAFHQHNVETIITKCDVACFYPTSNGTFKEQGKNCKPTQKRQLQKDCFEHATCTLQQKHLIRCFAAYLQVTQR
jgi:hypothetical protein